MRKFLILLALTSVAWTGGHTATAMADQSAPVKVRSDVPAEKIATLLEATRIPALVDVIAREGLANGPDLAADMFPGRGGVTWTESLGRIYDTDRMSAQISGRFPGDLSEGDIDVLNDFLLSDLGRRITNAEIETRVAMLDEALDAGAREIAQQMRAEGSPRVALISEFIEAYDLVTLNVVGGLNSNYAFFQGMAAGGALPRGMTEDQMINEVWSQQDEIRTETEDWLYAYLIAAYSGLSDDEMRTYIAFAQTPVAAKFNAVIFEAFDGVFTTISHDLGRAVAGYLVAEDI